MIRRRASAGEKDCIFFTILRLISGVAPCLMRFAEAEKESRSREKKTTSNEKGKEHEAKNGEPRL